MASAADGKQILVLELVGAEYGFPADAVREIVRLVEITPVPESPPFLKGVIDYRGQIAVVIDLPKRLKLGDADYDNLATQIIVVEHEGNLVGLVVDRVLNIITVDEAGVLTTRGDLPLPEDLLAGAYEDGDRLLVLLDLAKILDGNGRDYLKKARKKAGKK